MNTLKTVITRLIDDDPTIINRLEEQFRDTILEKRANQQRIGLQLSTYDIMVDASKEILIDWLLGQHIALVQNHFVMFDDTTGWTVLDGEYDKNDFVLALDRLTQSFGVSGRALNGAADMIAAAIKTRPNPSVIQFGDCYLHGQTFHRGTYSAAPPQFIIHRNCWEYLHGKSLADIHVSAVDDLIEQVAGSREDGERFLAVRACGFVLDKEFYLNFGRAVYVYGPRGGEGKTLYTDLEHMMLGDRNYSTFSYQQLDDYHLANMARSLFAYDLDADCEYMSGEPSTIFKQIVSHDEMTVREIYGKPQSIHPSCSLRMTSNHFFKANEKSRALLRRFDFYKTGPSLDTLQLPSSWFEALKTQKAADYLFVRQILALKKVIESQSLPPVTERGQRLLDLALTPNNSIITFIEERGLDRIMNWTVRDVREVYEQWCNESGATVLGLQKFNAALEAESGLTRKNLAANRAHGPAADAAMADQRCAIKCWVSD